MSASPPRAVTPPSRQPAPAAATDPGHPLPPSFGTSLKRMSPTVQGGVHRGHTEQHPTNADDPAPQTTEEREDKLAAKTETEHKENKSTESQSSEQNSGQNTGQNSGRNLSQNSSRHLSQNSSRNLSQNLGQKSSRNSSQNLSQHLSKNLSQTINQNLEAKAIKTPSTTSVDENAINDNDTTENADDSTAEPYPAESDLQFAKKDYRLRTQLFQSVLSSASLKLLKAQHMQPAPPGRGTSLSKNFQLYIQAPVLLATLRRNDDVAIGQQMPFVRPGSVSGESEHRRSDSDKPAQLDDDDDEYREQTMLQQQRLTLNALKKLSLSLAPIIYDGDDALLRQLTTRQLNPAEKAAGDKKDAEGERKEARGDTEGETRGGGEGREEEGASRVPRPYQPAQVDLSSFASLTRQSKHLDKPETPGRSVDQEAERQLQQRQSLQTLKMAQRLARQSQPQLTDAQPGQNQASQLSRSGRSSQQFANQTPNQPTRIGDQLVSQSSGMHYAIPNGSQSNGSSNGFPNGSSNSFPHGLPNGSQPNTSHGNQLPARRGVMLPRKASVQHEPLTLKQPVPDRKVQQIKGFRSPMYVPAVLRRTVDDDHATPIIEEESPDLHATASPSNSVASAELQYSTDSHRGNALRAGPYVLAPRQHDYIVRAAPTRRHWLRDETVAECGAAACHKRFNFFERRHHCRKCGGIFCKEHTLHFLYINHLAQFTTGGRGTLSRVCDGCIDQYNDFIQHEFGTGSVSLSPPQHTETAEPMAHKAIGSVRRDVLVKHANVQREDTRTEPVVGSVPANWSWSSF